MGTTSPAKRGVLRVGLVLGLLLMVGSVLFPTAAMAAPAQSMHSGEKWVRVYTVRPGDTLGSIALYYDVSIAELMEANDLRNPNRIVVGQDLIIPDARMGGPGVGGPECADYHVVRRGETLSAIALAHGMDSYDLARANGIYDLNEIYVGQYLCISGRGKPAKPAEQPMDGPDRPREPMPAEPMGPKDGPSKPMPGPAMDGPKDGPQRPMEPMPMEPKGPDMRGPDRPMDGPDRPMDGPDRPKDGPDGPRMDGPDRPMGGDQFWKGSYFQDKYFAEFVEERKDSEIRFNWYTGKPFEGMPEDRFSVRWEKIEYFKGGWYRFVAVADDGVRVYVDDTLVIDGWKIQPATEYKGDIFIHEGGHRLVVEYYEEAEDAQISVEWHPIRK